MLTFIYTGRDGDLIKLSYRPNPVFNPLHARLVSSEMQGELWVHEREDWCVYAGNLLRREIAEGFLGHLEKGGHFSVEQRELSPGQWTSLHGSRHERQGSSSKHRCEGVSAI
jgi:hypothetical protein